VTTSRRWRKSTHSQNTSTCVELANTLDAIRDSKNPTALVVAHLSTFLTEVKRGRFDY
jgi:hypothetical protein